VLVNLAEGLLRLMRLSGGTAEADEVLIPKRDKWADQKRLTSMRVLQF